MCVRVYDVCVCVCAAVQAAAAAKLQRQLFKMRSNAHAVRQIETIFCR